MSFIRALLISLGLILLAGCSKAPTFTSGRLVIIGDDTALPSDDIEELDTWPFRLQRLFDRNGYTVNIVNISLYKMSLASFNKSLPFSLTANEPDAVMLMLGYYDVMNEGKQPLLLDMEKLIETTVQNIHALYPDKPLYLCEMTVPAVTGLSYSGTFTELYKRVAQKYDYVYLIKSPYSKAFKAASQGASKGRVLTNMGHEMVAEYLHTELVNAMKGSKPKVEDNPKK